MARVDSQTNRYVQRLVELDERRLGRQMDSFLEGIAFRWINLASGGNILFSMLVPF